MRDGNFNALFNCYAKTTNYTFAYVLCTKISRKKNSFEMKFCSTLLLAEGKMMKEKRNTCPESLSRWVVVWPVIYMQNLNNTIFPPRGSVFLFQSRTILVLIQFLRHTAFISYQPSLSSLCLIWNDMSTIVTFLVTDIPQNYSVAEIRANE